MWPKKLISNGRLAHPVELQAQFAYQVAGGIGSGAHGGHAGRLLADLGLQQNGVNHVVQIKLHHIFQHALGIRLENIVVGRL